MDGMGRQRATLGFVGWGGLSGFLSAERTGRARAESRRRAVRVSMRLEGVVVKLAEAAGAIDAIDAGDMLDSASSYSPLPPSTLEIILANVAFVLGAYCTLVAIGLGIYSALQNRKSNEQLKMVKERIRMYGDVFDRDGAAPKGSKGAKGGSVPTAMTGMNRDQRRNKAKEEKRRKQAEKQKQRSKEAEEEEE
ncbi:hypothetical protein NDN08_002283 [Rhodosorus marinus]|uniref:Uncharacterized protein n=1 Tax=Rhodosorus marinus TaxID=101924 RepID=A0AAV8UTD3_9RHOD|nr:hypothetical protein NDN08_002283 [Rhodosorus marinus]